MGVKPCLPFVPLADAYQVIRIAQIELGEDGGMRERLESGTMEGDGVLIFDGDSVKLAVIDTRPQAAILLSHKEETRGNRGGGRLYDA